MAKSVLGQPAEGDFCPRCGLLITAASRAGSITGYMFQDTRCKCLPDPAFHADSMTQKLLLLRRTKRGQTFAGTDDLNIESRLNLISGAIIGGAYVVKRLIGHGGMGEVYLAHHLRLDRDCVLKVIPPDQVTDIGWMRFQQEARAVSKLNHVNVVQVSDLGLHEGCLPFYAMEYVPGHNLAELLNKYGPMPLSKALEIFKQVCDGVDYAHLKGIIHRDLKPANIMVSDFDSSKPVVKILDFGLAKLTQADHKNQSLTAFGDVFGSPFYMSPEQCEGDVVDSRSDIYSVGCALFESLTGRPPFTGNLSAAVMRQHQECNAPKLNSISGHLGFPENLEILIAKMLRKNPDERYHSAAAVKTDLERIERGESIEPYELCEPLLDRGKDAAEATIQGVNSEVGSEQCAAESQPSLFVYITLLITALIAVGTFVCLQLSPSISELERRKLAHYVLEREAQSSLGIDKTQNNSVDLIAAQRVASIASQAAATSNTKISDSKVSESAGVFRDSDILPEHVEAEAKVHCDSKPFFRKDLMQDGVSYSQFQFPDFSAIEWTTVSQTKPSTYASFSMGDLSSTVDRKTEILAMDGVVDVPTASKRFYTPSRFALEHPVFLKNFRNGDFAGLRLTWPESVKQETLSQSLQILGKLNIKELFVFVSLNSEQYKALKCLKTIQGFEGFVVKDLSGYFAEMRGSQRLEHLRMNFANLTQENLDCIVEMPHIKILQIDADDNNLLISAKQFSKICQLKELTHLYATRLTYSEETALNLAKLKSLRVLNFTGDSSWGPSQIARLRRALPSCEVYVLRQTSGGLWRNFKV